MLNLFFRQSPVFYVVWGMPIHPLFEKNLCRWSAGDWPRKGSAISTCCAQLDDFL